MILQMRQLRHHKKLTATKRKIVCSWVFTVQDIGHVLQVDKAKQRSRKQQQSIKGWDSLFGHSLASSLGFDCGWRLGPHQNSSGQFFFQWWRIVSWLVSAACWMKNIDKRQRNINCDTKYIWWFQIEFNIFCLRHLKCGAENLIDHWVSVSVAIHPEHPNSFLRGIKFVFFQCSHGNGPTGQPDLHTI